MKVYLVGGAIRDQLLKYPVKERDWVVVGATPNEMLSQGYKQVGRDFPVFLHPKSGEEYALARTERKHGSGYHGFICDASASITLEEDLSRRDLTINAIAQDDQGNLIDPYGGVADLTAKQLRHVSPAFCEDPVRVLRVARFAARYHHLGFQLAPTTRQLMYQMVKSGELAYLVAERVWQELEKSLSEQNPEIFFTLLRSCGALKVILPELDQLFGIPNSPRYHHEIDSGVHSLYSLQAATKLTTCPKIRFAALVHDLGKVTTPQKFWPKHPNHEQESVQLVSELCKRLRIPQAYKQLAVLASRFHLTIHCLIDLSSEAIITVFEATDAFRRPQLFYELLTVCQADAEGCGRPVEYLQADQWRFLLAENTKITAAPWVALNYQGEAIKMKLREQRVAHTAQLMSR